MSEYGDTVGQFDSNAGIWTAPNGSADITADVVAGVDKFANLPGAPLKSRLDLHPARPDRIVSITDITLLIDAFRGLDFPFVLGQVPCN